MELAAGCNAIVHELVVGESKFGAARPHFEKYLASVKGYKQNSYPDNAEYRRLVQEQWADILDAQGYPVLT